jgi:group I intron endonuclease
MLIPVKWDNKIGGIYQIKNLINEKIYIGSTNYLYGRFKQHYNDLLDNHHANKYLQNSWNKYNEDNFEFSILEEITNEDLLIEREQFWMDKLKSYNISYGYNILPKAGRTIGVKRSDETKKRLSDSKIGDKNPMYQKEVSIETRRRLSKSLINMPEEKKTNMLKKRGIALSQSLKGRKLSNETKQKLSNIKLGRKLPDSQKEKIKISNSIKIVQVDLNGFFIKEWNSMIDVTRELSFDCGSISKCCNKISKTYKKFLWFFAEEYYSDNFNISDYISKLKRNYSI